MSMGQFRSSQATLAHGSPDLGGGRAVRWARLALWVLGRACDLILTWQERARQRRELALLNDYMLRDIGLSRADVLAEATKRFWER
jgi:uncharacterized protein YjiS (DUF1127 family)